MLGNMPTGSMDHSVLQSPACSSHGSKHKLKQLYPDYCALSID